MSQFPNSGPTVTSSQLNSQAIHRFNRMQEVENMVKEIEVPTTRAYLFRAYTASPVLVEAPKVDRELDTTPRELPVVATLAVSLTEQHIGKKFKALVDGEESRFLIRSVSSVYNPKMIGEPDARGEYRIIAAVKE